MSSPRLYVDLSVLSVIENASGLSHHQTQGVLVGVGFTVAGGDGVGSAIDRERIMQISRTTVPAIKTSRATVVIRATSFTQPVLNVILTRRNSK